MGSSPISAVRFTDLVSLTCGPSSKLLGYCHASATRTGINIKRIYVEVIQNTVESRKIEPLLKSELEKRGFTVVDSVEAADAILSGEIMTEVVLDGNGSIPHKAIYRYHLALPSKEVVWKAKVKFTTVLDFAQDNERAARKITEKLLSDWQKSAKDAARNTSVSE